MYDKQNDSHFMIMAWLTDAILILTGALSLLANNKLEEKFPEILSKANLQAPKRKWLLLLLTIIHIMHITGLLFWYIMESLEKEIENWLLEAATNLPGPMIWIINGRCLLITYLFNFGCIASNYVKNTYKAIENDALCNKKYIVHIEKVLKEYVIFKKSVSFGLFIILTLQTVAAIIVLYLTIVQLRTADSETSFRADMVIFWVSLLWSCATCLILVYLCLVATDVDTTRMDVIQHLW